MVTVVLTIRNPITNVPNTDYLPINHPHILAEHVRNSHTIEGLVTSGLALNIQIYSVSVMDSRRSPGEELPTHKQIVVSVEPAQTVITISLILNGCYYVVYVSDGMENQTIRFETATNVHRRVR